MIPSIDREVGELEYYLSVLVVGLLHSPPLRSASRWGKEILWSLCPLYHLPLIMATSQTTSPMLRRLSLSTSPWPSRSMIRSIRSPASSPPLARFYPSLSTARALSVSFNKAQDVFGCKAILVVPRDLGDFYDKPNNQVERQKNKGVCLWSHPYSPASVAR